MQEGKIRFTSTFVSKNLPNDPRIKELKKWCGEFQKHKLTPEFEGNYTGNLSFRSKEGFIITASGLRSKQNLTDECFVFVKRYEEQSNTFFVDGKNQPSSETLMHYLIYRNHKDINVIFHGHNNSILSKAEKLGIPTTRKKHYPGTKELAKEVLNIIGENRLIVLKNHGFLSLGKTMQEAGELALNTLVKSIN